MTSPEHSFDQLMKAAPSQPFVTYYDEASGERTELSVRSLGNWVAKTHFLLLDELGLGVGARAYVDLPAHWLSVPAVLGCLTAGLALTSDAGSADVAFAGRSLAPEGVPDVYAVGVELPGASDFALSVRPMPDAWASVQFAAADSDPCVDELSRAEVVSRARESALPTGARVLTTRDWVTLDDVVETLFAPLCAGGSVVYVRNTLDESVVERRMSQERATVRL